MKIFPLPTKEKMIVVIDSDDDALVVKNEDFLEFSVTASALKYSIEGGL